MSVDFIKSVSDKKNRERLAVIVIGYNRLTSIRRLLNSLLDSEYPQGMDVPLIISIDCSGDKELYRYVEEFQWPYGQKYVRIHSSRLGLKTHILSCGDLTSYFKGVILLEDDLYVSPYFYRYTLAALKYYEQEPFVGGISLYAHEINGYVNLPFTPLHNGSDSYAVQAVSSWGECWNERMWRGFRLWLAEKDEQSMDFSTMEIPSRMKTWTRSWGKFFNAYLIETDRYFIYPYVSLTTNFSDAGEHGGTDNTIVQVSLEYGPRDYCFRDFGQLVKYDIFSNNQSLGKYVGLPKEELCIDFYGNHEMPSKRYRLTPLELSYKKIRSYALNLRPQELNVIRAIEGNDLFLYDTSCPAGKRRRKDLGVNVLTYHLKGFRTRYLQTVVWDKYKRFVKRTLKLGVSE